MSPQPQSAGTQAVWFLCGGLLSACVAWGLINSFEDFFQLPSEVTSKIGVPADVQRRFDAGEISGAEVMGQVMGQINVTELAAEIDEAKRLARRKNNALAIGLLGLTVCGFLGLVTGITRRSARAAVVGLVIGSLLGAALGAVAGWGEIRVAEQLRASSGLDQTLQTVLTHAVAWGLVGAAAGLTSGALSRRMPVIIERTCASGISGAIAPFVFAPVAALVFPMDKTDVAIPAGTWSRFLWIVIGSALISLALALSGRQSRKTSAPTNPSPEPAGQ